MGYALFVLLNAVLFIRPEELWPGLEGSRLYLITISLCLLFNAPRLCQVLSPRELARNPIGVCVLALYFVVPLSNVVRGNLDTPEEDLGEFGKVILYYFLAVAVLNTTARFRSFLGWCVVLVLGLTLAAQLQWYEFIDIEQMRPVRQRGFDAATGEVTYSYRICSTGIFNDPNDLCLVLVFGTLCCAYRALTGGGGPLRYLWLSPVVAFVYTLTLTQSRGGMLGLLAGVAGVLTARYGGKRAVPIVLLCVPVMLFGVGGRQAEIGLGKGDTSDERIHLWSEGLTEIISRPTSLLTGIGAHEFAAEFAAVAHNSFVHAYVELGLIGGSAFFGAFYWAGTLLRASATGAATAVDSEIVKARPFVVGMAAAYAIGIYSISRNYVIPTYLLLAVVTCYARLAIPTPPEAYRVSQQWFRRTAFVGVAAFVGLVLFTRVAGRLSS